MQVSDIWHKMKGHIGPNLAFLYGGHDLERRATTAKKVLSPVVHDRQQDFLDKHFNRTRRFARVIDSGNRQGHVRSKLAQHPGCQTPGIKQANPTTFKFTAATQPCKRLERF
jgi:hypothetical protein